MGNCNLFLRRCSKHVRSLVYLSLALVCYSSRIICASNDGRGLFSSILFDGQKDGRFDWNSDPESLDIDRLINLNRVVFEDLLNDDSERNDGLSVQIEHRIAHRGDTGPFRMDIDPNNARFLNATAKRILAQMMAMLSATTIRPALPAEEDYVEKVEKSCSKMCRNGGACLVGNDTEACLCLTGFRGEFCEFLDDCNRAPGCGTSASCVEDGGHLRCRCQDGYYLTEKGCVAGGQCREVTCQNGGTCLPLQLSAKLDSPKEFFCRCKLGYRGEFCEKVIPECDENPCNPDEVCIAIPNGAYCKSEKTVIKHRHKKLKFSWMSLLWLLIPLASFLLAPVIITQTLRWKRIRNLKTKKTRETGKKARNNRLNEGKVWFHNLSGKIDKADQQALLQLSCSDDDVKIQDGVGQVV